MLKVKYFVLIIIFGVFSIRAQEKQQTSFQRPDFDFNKWFLLISPFWGEVSNLNQIPFRVIQQKSNGFIDFHSSSKSFSGTGKGSGVELLAFKENWQVLFVNFNFPMYPNSDFIKPIDGWQRIQTKVTGNVLYLRYTFLKNNPIQPFIAMSHFQGSGPHDYSIVDQFLLYSYFTQKWIFFPKVDVKIYVEDPNPQVGLSFKLPIQNWKIETVYSYGFERVITNLKTTIGKTMNPFPLNNFYQELLEKSYDFSDPDDWIYPLNVTFRKKYFANRLGLSLFMDYRRFISLRITVRRDLTFSRWVSNAVFSLIFSKYFGLNYFYEYSERSVGTIRYWLIGPTFIFQI
ncbi:MAG: hypothetical protein ACK4UJ_00615 [Leptonema sp. (in: bacteria)]